MLSIIVKEEEFCCIQFRFVISHSVSFLCIQFSRRLSRGKEEKYNFLFSYKLYTRSLVLFADIF